MWQSRVKMAGWWTTAVVVLLTVGAVLGQEPTLEDYLNMRVDDQSEEHGQLAGLKPTNCSCGWTNKARIVGGRRALANEFPLMAGLKAKGHKGVFCGGFVVTIGHVITAAHCTYPLRSLRKIKLVVVVGEHDQSEKNGNKQHLAVLKTIEHERFNPVTFFNDISIVVLKKHMTFNQLIGPACLPSGPIELVNEQVKVLGWGRLSAARVSSDVLMKLNLRVIPLQMCKEKFKRVIDVDSPTQICTVRKNKDSCEGDSGGPLIWLDPETNRYTVVAIVSYGKTLCGTAPAVNTDVSVHLNWIQQKISATYPELMTCSKIE
uniref:Venom S1 protease 11 n=1 Tax=Lethocerus distinctifemur TaxID=280095 RepID=A0A2K8JVQ9_9HEMI|nr:venom S1 protease 11 [Lethocerus distinctifemur]